MFKILAFTKGKIIAFRAEGKIEKSDYDKINALLEKTNREYDKLRLYIQIDPSDIEGIEPVALWEDFKTYFRYFNKLEKLAIVGTGKLEESVTKLAKPFISGDVRYFSTEESSEAKKWIEEDLA
jgi:lactate dehydrogenase-like 2-hydroxyacid dehydrogenase